jgi:type II secretory pathway predicted ATPase ExeA
MFLEAFGLARDPFLDTADPAFYFATLPGAYGRRRLTECLASGRGLAIVVGQIGAGKTTLFNAVQQELLSSERNLVGSILDPTFQDEAELLVAIADCFAFDVDPAGSPHVIKDSLKRALFGAATAGRQPILFVDEAQLLSEGLLESLRAMLNYQLDERKLLSIALSGQAELAQVVLRRPNFSDRVALWLELAPLSESESAGLLHHRLRCAGFAGEHSPFEDDALHQLWLHSRGIPRRLTTLAREALEVAAERKQRVVRRADVEDAAKRSVPFVPPVAPAISGALARPRAWWQWWRSAS